MVKYIGSKEAAAKWGLTDRQVRILCGKGYVIGAIQTNKWVWCIPDDAPRPVDGRMARRYEQRNIRLGSIDITLLNALRAGNGLGDKLFTNQAFQGQLASLFSLGSALDKNNISQKEALSALSGEPRRISFLDAVKVLDFRAAILGQCGKGTGYDIVSLMSLHRIFCQGWNDRGGGMVREDGVEEGRLSCEAELVAFFRNYDSKWSSVHPIFKACLLMGQLAKLNPFPSDNGLFCILAVSAWLVGEGFLPPYLEADDMAEISADLALALGKGNYQDLARTFERTMKDAYRKVFQVAGNV